MRTLLPNNSILHHWLDAQSICETPELYDVVCGAAVIGALLRRDVFYDQILFRVFCNLGVLLVGPSGIGKDSAINQAERQILSFGRIPLINGTSIEAITGQLSSQPEGIGLLCAKEISALFGSKDWQSGLLTQMTNIMSGGDQVSAGLRSDATRMIKRPTVTFFGGSTPEWMHSHMPEGANEGGFLPRILVLVQYKNKRSVPLIDRLEKAQLALASAASARWTEALHLLITKYGQFGRFQFASNGDAKAYEDWYANRFKEFSTFAHAYSHRSRDNCLRLSMISAMSCSRTELLAEDVAFATGIISTIARHIDVIFAPPTLEARIAQNVFQMLPCAENKLCSQLALKFRPREIDDTLNFLRRTRQIIRGADEVFIRGEKQ